MPKPKVAFYWCASCGGCEETVVDLAEDILGIVEVVVGLHLSTFAALTLLQESGQKGEFATGLLYIDPGRQTFTDLLNTVDTPLSMLGQELTRPPKSALDEIMTGRDPLIVVDIVVPEAELVRRFFDGIEKYTLWRREAASWVYVGLVPAALEVEPSPKSHV